MIKFIAKLKYLIHVKISYISNNKLIKIIHRNVLYIPISILPPPPSESLVHQQNNETSRLDEK